VILVLEGKVEVVKGQGEDEILLARRGKGEVFGEMGFLEDRPRFATIRALEPTRILELSENTMRTVLAEQPDLLFRTTQILSSRLREAQMKMIVDLELKNQVLARAYRELKEAQAALVVKERMEHELELARKLQSSILPHHFPSLPGISFAARSKPARQVGGDFYDVIPLKDKRVGLVMADVSDKGMPAAIFMALSRSLIRAEARRSSSPKKVLLQTHKLLLEISQAGNSSSPMFVTIVYGVLDTVQGTFNYARAGHDFPLVYRQSERKCQTLKASGRVLGLTRQVALEEVQIDLHSGDMLVLYTDGIVDTNSPAGEFYGSERLSQAVCESKASTAQELCDFIFREIEDFQVKTEQYDDMALLITSIHAVD
jgi:serine phosphatase RsbU (regulator of sigma subunit)